MGAKKTLCVMCHIWDVNNYYMSIPPYHTTISLVINTIIINYNINILKFNFRRMCYTTWYKALLMCAIIPGISLWIFLNKQNPGMEENTDMEYVELDLNISHVYETVLV